MDLKRDLEESSEDVVMGHNYSSNVGDEVNFFATTVSQRNAEVGSHPEAEASGHDPTQHELQQLQREIQEESSRHEDTSVDLAELQLAAQLTQGLAAQHQARQLQEAAEVSNGHEAQNGHNAIVSQPHVVAHHEEQDMGLQHTMRVGSGELDGQESSQDRDLQGQIQAQLQNQRHEEDLQGAISQSLQPSQHHQYLAHAPSNTSAMPGLHMHSLATGYASSSDAVPRKRSKVSRACDECRRKKIKCDAVCEMGDQSCSNCRRSGATCLFSRIPQKRGPSKGYIKELADRIFTIEGRLKSGGEANTNEPKGSTQSFPSPTAGEKRSFSNISTAAVEMPTPPKQGAWAEHRPIQPAGPRPFMTVNDLTPRAILPANVEPRPIATLTNGLTEVSETSEDLLQEIDDDAFQLYLRVIHPVLPILATSKARVESILSQVPAPLREACLAAFQDLIHFFEAPLETNRSGPQAAISLYAEWEAAECPPDKATDVVSLQVLIMMAIRDSLISPDAKTQHAAASRRSALARAIHLGFSMPMFAALPDPVPSPEFDANSDANVSLRAWWTVFLLDRWNAIGSGSVMLIPEESTNLVPGLKPVLGTAGYKLVQLSEIFLPNAALMGQPAEQIDSKSKSRLHKSHVRIINIVFRHFNEQLPPDANESTHPFHFLVYWHVRIFLYLCSPDPQASALLDYCTASAALLLATGETGLVTPLNHHFVALTAGTLLELSDVDDTRDDALAMLRSLGDQVLPPSSYDRPVKGRILERLRPATAASLNSLNLQRLANLATATAVAKTTGEPEESKADEVAVVEDDVEPIPSDGLGFDPRRLLGTGYLTYFHDSSTEQTD